MYDLVLFEASCAADGAVTSACATPCVASHAIRYLDALTFARREGGGGIPPAPQMREMVRRLDDRHPPDDALIDSVETIVAPLRRSPMHHDPPTARIYLGAEAYHPLSDTARDHPRLATVAALVSALAMLPLDARPDDPVLAPPVVADTAPIDRPPADDSRRGSAADRRLAAFADGVALAARRTRALMARLSMLDEVNSVWIDEMGKAAASSHRVHRALQRWPIASLERIRDATGLQIQAATSALHRLRGMGTIRELTGRSRHRLYIYTSFMDILAEDIGP